MESNNGSRCVTSSSNYIGSKPPLSAQSEFRKKKPSKSKEYTCHPNSCGTVMEALKKLG